MQDAKLFEQMLGLQAPWRVKAAGITPGCVRWVSGSVGRRKLKGAAPFMVRRPTAKFLHPSGMLVVRSDSRRRAAAVGREFDRISVGVWLLRGERKQRATKLSLPAFDTRSGPSQRDGRTEPWVAGRDAAAGPVVDGHPRKSSNAPRTLEGLEGCQKRATAHG